MTKTHSRALSRKTVMSNDGKVIGMIKNITVDLETGQVIDLVIKPDSSFDTTGYIVEGDRMIIPFEAVKDIKDYIVIDRYLSKK
jgi:sporulation protein YlmC with PRC-barrel domain